jgi:hypothetical protein
MEAVAEPPVVQMPARSFRYFSGPGEAPEKGEQ